MIFSAKPVSFQCIGLGCCLAQNVDCIYFTLYTSYNTNRFATPQGFLPWSQWFLIWFHVHMCSLPANIARLRVSRHSTRHISKHLESRYMRTSRRQCSELWVCRPILIYHVECSSLDINRFASLMSARAAVRISWDDILYNIISFTYNTFVVEWIRRCIHIFDFIRFDSRKCACTVVQVGIRWTEKKEAYICYGHKCY